MTTLAVPPTAALTPARQTVPPPDPAAGPLGLADLLRRMAGNLLVACLVPGVGFYVVLRLAGVDAAIVAALTWGYGALVWRRVTGRPVSGLLVLTVSVLTLRSVFTLSTGNSYVYFLQPLVTDAGLAAAFLGSVTLGRPVVARLAHDFYPVSADLAARPAVQRLFTRLTLLWAGVCLLRSLGGLWLLNTLSVDDFVLVKESSFAALTVTAALVTMVAAVLTLRREQVLAS